MQIVIISNRHFWDIRKKTVGIVLLSIVLLTGCISGRAETGDAGKSNKLSVVTTIFPPYDFVREIGGENVEVTMLLSPGVESHSYEPTPQDIIRINESDLFIYAGGESDVWVEAILDSLDSGKLQTLTLMDCVETLAEESVNGVEAKAVKGEHSEVEYDEHVWTSPRNAALIVEKITDKLCEIDGKNQASYKEKEMDYRDQLEQLNQEYKMAVGKAARTELIFGDRFPFRYLAEAYGLSYYAAFPGCSSESEPSAATIAFLTDKVKEDKIPVILYLELSNHKIADAISEATGIQTAMLHSCHNISADEAKSGVTYVSLMRQNLEVLKGALR